MRHVDGHDRQLLAVVHRLHAVQDARRARLRAAAAGDVLPHRHVLAHAAHDREALPLLVDAGGGEVRVDRVDAADADVGLHEVHLGQRVPVGGRLLQRVASVAGLKEPEGQVVELVARARRDEHVRVHLQHVAQGQARLERHVRAVRRRRLQRARAPGDGVLAGAPGVGPAVRPAHVDVVARGLHRKRPGGVGGGGHLAAAIQEVAVVGGR
mmetsp:Transcript_51647/g.156931  ORF Transcript_51647/g.156931 Transcript_51647/m.156931 type:complete len:211 (-) Transcript_51647:11-643(-)